MSREKEKVEGTETFLCRGGGEQAGRKREWNQKRFEAMLTLAGGQETFVEP